MYVKESMLTEKASHLEVVAVGRQRRHQQKKIDDQKSFSIKKKAFQVTIIF